MSEFSNTILEKSLSPKEIGPIYLKNQSILKISDGFIIYIEFPFICHQARFSSSYHQEMTARRNILLLTYASSVKCFSSKDMADCTTALNDAIRKIFSFNRWESVRVLRMNFGYKSLVEIFAIASKKFLSSLPHHDNSIIRLFSARMSVDWIYLLWFSFCFFVFSVCSLSLNCWRIKWTHI